MFYWQCKKNGKQTNYRFIFAMRNFNAFFFQNMIFLHVDMIIQKIFLNNSTWFVFQFNEILCRDIFGIFDSHIFIIDWRAKVSVKIRHFFFKSYKLFEFLKFGLIHYNDYITLKFSRSTPSTRRNHADTEGAFFGRGLIRSQK